MLTARVMAPGVLDIAEVPPPRLAARTALVDIALCGVCGSDLGSWRSGVSRGAIFGHEWVGRVRVTAPDATGVKVGDRVIGAVPPLCGMCDHCRAGLPDECEEVFAVATGKDPAATATGGFSTAIAVVASRLMRVPDGVSDIAAALVEPTAVVVHGLLRCNSLAGAKVVVQGAGPIGLLAAQAARVLGAHLVLVVEPSPERRALAVGLGADAAVAPPGAQQAVLAMSSGLGADLVVECSGVPTLVQVGADLARRGGTLLLLGYPKEPSTVDAGSWMRRQLTVRTSLAYHRTDFQMAVSLIEQGRIDVTSLHTRTVRLENLREVFAFMAEGPGRDVKVLVDPRA